MPDDTHQPANESHASYALALARPCVSALSKIIPSSHAVALVAAHERHFTFQSPSLAVGGMRGAAPDWGAARIESFRDLVDSLIKHEVDPTFECWM